MSETCPAPGATPEAAEDKLDSMTAEEIAECKAKLKADIDARTGANKNAHIEYSTEYLNSLIARYKAGDTESVKNYIANIHI